MALNDFETSPEAGQPVEIYKIVYGENTALYYTNAEQPITYDGDTYVPIPISRSEVSAEGDLEDESVTITVPLDSEVALLFSAYPPSTVVTITARQGHVPRADQPSSWATGENFPVFFLGRILESERDGGQSKLTCDPATLRRSGLTRTYQWPCPLILYGTRCGAVRSPLPGVVAATSGNTITLEPGWNTSGHPDDRFVNGLAEWDGTRGREVRTILRVSGTDTLVLAAPVWDLGVGDSVDVLIGCQRTLADCEDIHANTVNYGGQPWIPTDGNPVGKNNHF